MDGGESWYESDTLARTLSQLDQQEFDRLERSRFLDLRPVAIPHRPLIVTENDYFDWPIATRIKDTVVVLFDRRRFHWGNKTASADENSGIRMVTCSHDGGRTWSTPIDVIKQAGRWETTLFGGWGGGLGVHDDKVYLAINEGVYVSADQGTSWKLVTDKPDFTQVPLSKILTAKEVRPKSGTADTIAEAWSPGARITFDREHGLIIWTTRDFKQQGRDGKTNSDYGKYLCAVYSPDYGTTWKFAEQELPAGLTLNEITPVNLPADGLGFLFRNGIRGTHFGQGYSETGWFPFRFVVTNMGPVPVTDTPDGIFNPVSKRIEAVVPFRFRDKPMELRLYSIDLNAFAKGDDWRFDGVLLRYRDPFGKSDGFNPVGGVVDQAAGMHRIYIWGGDARDQAGIFQLSRTLDSESLRQELER